MVLGFQKEKSFPRFGISFLEGLYSKDYCALGCLLESPILGHSHNMYGGHWSPSSRFGKDIKLSVTGLTGWA